MAHRLASLGGVARRAINRASAQAFARPYASSSAHGQGAVAVDSAFQNDDAFLKWTTPEPQAFTHAGILASPATKVRVGARRDLFLGVIALPAARSRDRATEGFSSAGWLFFAHARVRPSVRRALRPRSRAPRARGRPPARALDAARSFDARSVPPLDGVDPPLAHLARPRERALAGSIGRPPRPSVQRSILPSTHSQVTTLANGMRVATEETPFAETATVGVWIDAGSRYETAANNGTAHFLEHMAFKGTAKRTTAGLEEEVENLGAHLNAYTSREQTTYYAKVFKKDVPNAVDILSDILQNSSLEQRHIERERGVILREMEEVEKEVEEVLFDHLHATAFQQTGLGRTILGSADNVRNITKENLSTYIKQHYTAPRMVLVGTGAVDHDALVKLAEGAFSNLPSGDSGESVRKLVSGDPAHFTGSDVRIRDDDMPNTSFCVAFKGASWTSPDAVPLMVMQAMLGSWDKAAAGAGHAGSDLAQDMHSNNLANSYMAFNTNYADTGLFGVHVNTDVREDLDDVAFVVMNSLRNLIYDPKIEDVTRAKQALKSSLLLHGESSTSAAAEEIGRQLLTYGRRIPRAELFARIDAVTVDTVKATAWKYIRDECPAIAAIGPTQFLPDYNWFRSSTYDNFY